MDGGTIKYDSDDNYRLRIKDLPLETRPREKFIKYGARSVSNAELLAILIGSGTKKISAIDLANKILSDAGSLRELARKDLSDLKKYKGIGLKKAVVISAAFELSRRIQSESALEKPQIMSPEDVAKIFKVLPWINFNAKARLLIRIPWKLKAINLENDLRET